MLSNNVIGGVYMDLFYENKERICCCNEALKKGIFTKSISNDSFCVYGSIIQGKNILLNYSGKLVKDFNIAESSKKNAPNIYMYYCFDNNWKDKKIVNMSVCSKNNKLSYCSIIDNIPDSQNINLAFTDDNQKWDTDKCGTYCLKIYPDIEKNIMKRYGLDSTPPTILQDTLPKSYPSLKSKLKTIIINTFLLFKNKYKV